MESELFFTNVKIAKAVINTFKKLNPAVRSFYRIVAEGRLLESDTEWFNSLNSADKTDFLDIVGAYLCFKQTCQAAIDEEFAEFCTIWRIECTTP